MRRASLVIILIGLVLIPGSRAFADGWPDVGSAKRPAWVDAAAERRLRLLSALPALQNTLHSEANAYFGSAGPGLSVGLVLDDGLYYSRGFGFADAQRTVVPDEHTIYRAGSLSKVMTGTALLTLIDDDSPNSPKMTLFDAADEQRYLPELKSVCPVFNQNCARGSQSLGITLANLVSHTSGLPDVMEQGNASVAAWLTDLQKSWLLFKPANPSNPGNLSAYSGVGIEGVGLIEQRISHKPYVDFVTQNLFLPLGMKHSSMDQTKLPGSLQAQKWMFSVSEKDPCKASCMTEEQLCMQDAHSGPERGACAKAQLNCTGKCPPPKSSYSFAQFDGMIGGDDQPMIAPAGGLATSVEDLGLFIKMWLSATAPTVNGHPLLKKKTIQDAATPLFTTVGSVPASCGKPPNPITDSNNFAYSNCGLAQTFRVNWAVNQPPNIEHNGDEPGLSGSNTRLDQSNKMGATGLISTEPYPQPPQDSNIPQPAGLDPVFIDSVVYGTLNAGEAADKANPDWAGQVLADGVARVLYLSGKVPQAGDLAAFSASFIAANKLTAANVAGFLTNLHNQIGPCRTFRVRDANSPTSVELRLSCQKSEWDMILSVEAAAAHKISWQTVSPKPPSPPSKAQCQAACNIAEGPCMSQAHSSAERQACIAEKKTCMAECNKK